MKNHKIVEEWLSSADDDIELAKRSITGDRKIVWAACFHSQQSAEKYLKAFLIANDQDPPRIHDLEKLNELCIKIDNEFILINDLCKLLTPYSVQARYPEELGLEQSDADNAIKAANEIKDFILRKVE